MKLTKVQKMTRFTVYSLGILLLLSLITGILPTFLCGIVYRNLGL